MVSKETDNYMTVKNHTETNLSHKTSEKCKQTLQYPSWWRGTAQYLCVDTSGRCRWSHTCKLSGPAGWRIQSQGWAVIARRKAACWWKDLSWYLEWLGSVECGGSLGRRDCCCSWQGQLAPSGGDRFGRGWNCLHIHCSIWDGCTTKSDKMIFLFNNYFL